MTAISQGGAAKRVKVLTAADLKANGGSYALEGRPPLAVYGVSEAETKTQGGQFAVEGNIAQPVYIVESPDDVVTGNVPVPMIAVEGTIAVGNVAIPVYVVGGSLGGLDPVTNLTLAIGNAPAYDEINATWGAVSGATGYEIEYSDDGVAWTPVDTTAGTNYALTNADYDVDAAIHYVRVRAVNGSGESDWVQATIAGILLNTFSVWNNATNTDLVGSNDLTTNGTVGSRAGLFGNAWDFTGNPNYLSHADSTELRMGGSFTIAGLVYLDTSQDYPALAAKGSGNSLNYQISIGTSIGVEMYLGNGAAQLSATITPALSTGQWYWIVATYNASTELMTVSINAGTRGTNTFTGTRQGSATELRVGRESSGTVYLDGGLNLLLFCNRAWSEAQEDYFYNGGTGRNYPFTP